MPEIISKQPEIVIAVLKQAGMHCGTGAKQNILTSCPSDIFCALPNGKGELCVYSPGMINNMTQMSSYEFIHYPDFLLPGVALAVMFFIAGMFAGIKLK